MANSSKGNGRVQIAYLHPNITSHSFSDSLMRLMAHDIAGSGRVVRTGGPVKFRCGTGGLIQARNKVVEYFLDQTDHQWLLMIDSDMGFEPDLADQLVMSAEEVGANVMGALCFAPKEISPDGYSGWQTRAVPTLYEYAQLPDGTKGFVSRRDYRVGQIQQVAATGAACLLVGREPLERARDYLVDRERFNGWFDPIRGDGGVMLSEDISFCALLGNLGEPIYVDTSIRTTHHKEVWLSEDRYWHEFVPEPAATPTAVIVPVLRRPQNAEPFMRSLRATTGLATAWAIADVGDVATVQAWRDAGASIIGMAAGADEPGTFAEKVNLAAREIQAELFFVTGDDVRFHDGWLNHAQHVMRHSGAAVVGTNDLGTRRVIRGEHATHLLIKREYVISRGSSFDGPGVLAHEGYRHWYVDDEIVTLAKARQEWAFAMGSVVEHLHPLFGKGEDDDTYRIGQASQDADRALFAKRLRMFHVKQIGVDSAQ